jgi:ligand-binding sensor domain-containing protein
MAVPLVVLAGAAAVVLLRTERTLTAARTAAKHVGQVSFDLRSLNRSQPSGTAFEPVGSAAGFSAVAFFQGNLYLAGPAGLFVYGTGSGSLAGATSIDLLRTYRIGAELPAAPISGLATGTLRGESAPSLLIATAGEGVLLFTPGTAPQMAGSFRQLRPQPPGLRDVTALLPLPTGELLIGTRRAGLLAYSGDALTLFRPELAGVPITALAADATGGVWVGTRDRGALHWTGGVLDTVGAAEGLPDDQVESLAVAGSTVYVGTPVGVAELQSGKVARQLAPGSFAHTLALTPDGKSLEVGTLEEGVLEVPLAPGAAHHASLRAASWTTPGNAAEPVAAFASDAGALYAVAHDGLRRKTEAAAWDNVLPAPQGGLTDGNISALAFTPDGRLWVGYFDHGIDILDVGLHRTAHIEDDAVFCINRLLVDTRGGRGTMVAATANGLALFDASGKERQVLTRRDGLISDHITDVAGTRKGLALATPAGLTFVDADGTSSLYGFQGLVNNHVYAIAVQPDGDTLLAGTLGGVSLLSAEAVQRNLTVGNSGLKHNWITAAVAMPGGGWMVGTYGAGVMRLEKDGHFTPMDGATREMVVNPNAMLATGSHVFTGTLGQGLWVWSRATGRWTQWTQGLPSGNVTALAERNGELYVGTEDGLVRIAEHSLDQGGAE